MNISSLYNRSASHKKEAETSYDHNEIKDTVMEDFEDSSANLINKKEQRKRNKSIKNKLS